jgi:hypothetical protein
MKKEFLSGSFHAHALHRLEGDINALLRWKKGVLSGFQAREPWFRLQASLSWFWMGEVALFLGAFFVLPMGIVLPVFSHAIPSGNSILLACFIRVCLHFMVFAALLAVFRLWRAFGKIGTDDLKKIDGLVTAHPGLLPLMVRAAGKKGVLRVRDGDFFLAAGGVLEESALKDQVLHDLCVELGHPVPGGLSSGALEKMYRTLTREKASLLEQARNQADSAERAASPIIQAIVMETHARKELNLLEKVLPAGISPSRVQRL